MNWIEHYFNQTPAADGSLPTPADCSFCGGKASLTVERGTSFSCSSCGARGMAYDLMAKLEGIPADSAGQYNDLILNTSGDAQLPSWDDIQKWQDNLFNDAHKEVRSVLGQVYGLDENDLRGSNVGLDESTGETVLPIVNGTGANPSGVKRLTLDKIGAVKESRFVAVNRLLGYSYRSFQNAPKSPVIVAENDFDRVYLQKAGLLCVTSADGLDAWDDAFSKLLKGRDVLVLLSDAGISDEKTLELLSDIAGKVTSLAKLAVTDVRNHPRRSIDEAIRNAPKLTKDSLRVLGLIQAAQKQAPQKIRIHPAQDFADEQMMYGVTIGGEPHLLTSQRKVLPFTDLERYELIVEKPSVSRMTSDGLRDYFAGNLIVQADALLEEIKLYIRKYVVLTNEEIYTVLAAWVMGTYVYRIFRTYPYVHVQAEKGSGKTTLMDILHPVCFNGQSPSSSDSSAVIFRDVHSSASTLFLDEVENLKKRDSATFSDVISVLNSGYRAGGRVRRLGPKREIEEFATYSPKMFAGIEDINETLDQRSIRIRMIVRLEDEAVEEYKSTKEEQTLQAALRDKLYVFGLEYGPRLWGRYKELVKNPYMTGVINRKRDVWGPLFTVGQIADESRNDGTALYQESIKVYMGVEEDLHGGGSEGDNLTQSLIIALKQMLGKVTPLSQEGTRYRFLNEDVFSFFTEQPKFKERFKKKDVNSLTTLLSRRLGITAKPQTTNLGSKRCYDIDLEQLNKVGLRLKAWTQEELDREAKVAEEAST